jgi:hypothetical protein
VIGRPGQILTQNLGKHLSHDQFFARILAQNLDRSCGCVVQARKSQVWEFLKIPLSVLSLRNTGMYWRRLFAVACLVVGAKRGRDGQQCLLGDWAWHRMKQNATPGKDSSPQT